jgi:hypothetical protein
MDALLIRAPFIDWILKGSKTWEIRGNATKKRGLIALVQSGSGTIVGACRLTEVYGPLHWRQLAENADKLGELDNTVNGPTGYKRTYAWELTPVIRLARPVRYDHPPGAVIWTKLDDVVAERVRAQLEGTPLASEADAATSASAPAALPVPDGVSPDDLVDDEPVVDDDFLALPTDQQQDILFDILIGEGIQPLAEAIPGLAEALCEKGFVTEETKPEDGVLLGAIERVLAAGVADGEAFDAPEEATVRAILPDPKSLTRDAWRFCLLEALAATPGPTRRDEALKRAAETAREVLGIRYQRLHPNGPIIRGLKSALNGAIRKKEIVRLDAQRIQISDHLLTEDED